VSAVEVPELTEEEERDRLHLERKVERAFYEAGKALMELRDRRLYRSTHKTFEEYCRDRFGHSRRLLVYSHRSSRLQLHRKNLEWRNYSWVKAPEIL
jgi:hypothetical protein